MPMLICPRFWVEAFSTAVYIINLLPASTLKFKSPFEVLCCKQPDYLHLQPFGCACFPFLDRITSTNFSFTLPNVYFWGIVIFILVLKVYILLEESTSHDMFISIQRSFLFLHYGPHPLLILLSSHLPVSPLQFFMAFPCFQFFLLICLTFK